MKTTLTLAKRTLRSFRSDTCATLAAAIAYHAVFALFPIALLGVALPGFVIGGAAAASSVTILLLRHHPPGWERQEYGRTLPLLLACVQAGLLLATSSRRSNPFSRFGTLVVLGSRNALVWQRIRALCCLWLELVYQPLPRARSRR